MSAGKPSALTRTTRLTCPKTAVKGRKSRTRIPNRLARIDLAIVRFLRQRRKSMQLIEYILDQGLPDCPPLARSIIVLFYPLWFVPRPERFADVPSPPCEGTRQSLCATARLYFRQSIF